MSDFVGGPIRRNGGKTHIAKRVINHFPNAYHYAEPFFGAGGMFFSIPQDLYQVRSFNDIDDLVIALFKEIRDNPNELQRICEMTPYADQELKEAFKQKDNKQLTNLEKARIAWIIGRMAFATHSNGWWYNNGTQAGNVSQSTVSKCDQLLEYAKFIRLAQIHNRDALEYIDCVDGPDTLFYCDPPYVTDTKQSKVTYLNEFSDEDHRKLAAKLHSVQGKVCISGYPSELYNELYGTWRRIDINAHSHMAAGRAGDDSERVECIWMNYDEKDEIGQYKPKLKANTKNEQQLLSILKRTGRV